MNNTKNVLKYYFGFGSLRKLNSLLKGTKGMKLFFLDHYFENKNLLYDVRINNGDFIHFLDTTNEITTADVNEIMNTIKTTDEVNKISTVIGIGGGSTLDLAKAISNLITNDGKAEDYQGWDLVKNPGVYKIGIPTLSGTGAESSRTCVMINSETGLKLGMNSDHTIFDQLILDPELTASVSRNQYFYSGMDTFIHCVESLNGSRRHYISDTFSNQALKLCKEVFSDENMMAINVREKLMAASYLGGSAIANSFVGVIHPFSAGLSVVLGIHHCEANCIAMRAMEEFYPSEFEEFWRMAEHQQVHIKKDICKNLSEDQYRKLYESTIIHEKPLANALGNNFKDILTIEKVIDIFQKM